MSTANPVTAFARTVSLTLGLCLYTMPLPVATFALLPLGLFLHMGFHAIDGMQATAAPWVDGSIPIAAACTVMNRVHAGIPEIG